ncbi:hypothetical protein LOTGIDRAFT_177167 [Lottia gigantea]|uniref:AP-3 complex subunit delta domain-containing protein n=1 Tax=Lottia gigantea TaxID=225164 RepID=V4BHW1_LOTGI|nr:hypothetical protein LOTGIDRAFT_177167 [Lottia gigantea]ESP05472.1 hypothetical protein LOTGIDRAFT_177167 [Lottia gigantea]
MALRKVKGTLDRVMDKNLQDLVRGIRNHKESESKYIADCIDEIKQELKQDNLAVKANAVSKLNYLQMLGYDISWAAFNVIEVMSSTKFTYKRIGYLAASQSFHDGTDVLMLTTNMIRKDLSSQNMYDAGVALNGLSCFITVDLARDLANDIMTLMTSSKPYLRKKAVLIMYKVFLKFPEALRPAFPRLKEKLEDPDPGAQSAAVNVICELARKNPKNYLSLAPLFFKLMTSSTNNWVLIKIIKLFGALTPLEPRLGKKLIEPLTNLIHSTSAMSLLYECINTVIAVLVSISSGIPNHSASIQLCVQKLRILIEDSDQNLKYLGLLAMSRILATHPKSVQSHKDLILQCLDDKDESIRIRALDLLYGMVSKKNLMEIVKKLMVHMDKAEGSHYRDELLSKIIEICSQSNYQFITNFEWYVSILVELTRMEGTRHGKLIASQMLDVAIRVQAIRHFTVTQMALLLENSHALVSNSQRNGICEVLYAAAWVCGEFAEHLSDPLNTLECMLRPKITILPGHIQSVYVQNMLKLYGKVVKRAEDEENEEMLKNVNELLSDKLPIFIQSADLEVQERACCILQVAKYVGKLHEKGAKMGDELEQLYAGDLNPVAVKAQKKVPVPEGLDLDEWINAPPSDSEEDEIQGASIFTMGVSQEHRAIYQYDDTPSKKTYEPTEEEITKSRSARKVEQLHNPNYLKDDGKSKRRKNDSVKVDNIPVAEINLSVPLHIPGSSSDKYARLSAYQDTDSKNKRNKKGKKKKRKHGDEESDHDIEVLHAVSTVVDMPEGIHLSDNDNDDDNSNDLNKKLDMDLDQPLRDDERLPKTKKKKEKKKKEKKKKEKKEKLKRSEYEVAEGITTPSKENISVSQQPTPLDVQLPPMSSYQLLAENTTLKMTCEVRATNQRSDQIIVSIVFTNLSQNNIKDLEFNVLDTLNTKLIRGLGHNNQSDAVKVPFNILPESQNEGQFAFSVENITMPQKLRGTLTYIVKSADGSSHDKIDFKLSLPCSSYLVTTPCKSADFTTLLSSGDLTAKSSLQLTPTDSILHISLTKLCFFLHFRVIEQVDNSASLYSRSIQGHPVCVLVKKVNDSLKIDGKSTDNTFLSNVLDDVRNLLTAES